GHGAEDRAHHRHQLEHAGDDADHDRVAQPEKHGADAGHEPDRHRHQELAAEVPAGDPHHRLLHEGDLRPVLDGDEPQETSSEPGSAEDQVQRHHEHEQQVDHDVRQLAQHG